MVFYLLDELPVELVGTNVLGRLNICDIVMLERASCSEASQKHFLDQIPHCPPLMLPKCKHFEISTLDWFIKRRLNLKSLTISLPANNPVLLHAKKLKVGELDLHLKSNVTMDSCKPLLESDVSYLVKCITIDGNQHKEIVEQISLNTRNVERLCVFNSNNYYNWLNSDILSRWKLKECILYGSVSRLLIAHTFWELTTIKLRSCRIDDAVVVALAQHCPKLEKLDVSICSRLTYKALFALCEHKLPLEELKLPSFPIIHSTQIAERCTHALSCIRHLRTFDFDVYRQDASMVIPYLTGLTSVCLEDSSNCYIHMLIQYCSNLAKIEICGEDVRIEDILSLCCANPLLQEFYYSGCDFTDIALIKLIHACPHLHTLRLPNETNITDTGILALSEHCPQLQRLDIDICYKVTEAAVLQLLQRCRKLTRLEVSSSIMSEETWTLLDKNTQKRVSRC